MKALKPVTLLDGIERRVHQVKLELRLAKYVIAGRSVDADSREIDRGGLGHSRERIGHLHQIVGVDVIGAGWIRPRVIWPELSKVIALEKDDRARALAPHCGEIVARAKILAVNRHPYGLRGRGALRARRGEAAQHIRFLDDVRV